MLVYLIGILYILANVSTASGKLIFSFSSINFIAPPFVPHVKQLKIPSSGFIDNDGRVSSWNGQIALFLLLTCKYFETTSKIFTVALTWSIVSLLIPAIAIEFSN